MRVVKKGRQWDGVAVLLPLLPNMIAVVSVVIFVIFIHVKPNEILSAYISHQPFVLLFY
jgi:hypothetical protein